MMLGPVQSKYARIALIPLFVFLCAPYPERGLLSATLVSPRRWEGLGIAGMSFVW